MNSLSWRNYCRKAPVKFSFQYRVIHSLLCLGLSARGALYSATALALILMFSNVASALLSGDASLTYSNYAGSADVRDDNGQAVGRNSMSSHSLVQNYSLLYSSYGPIYNSRVGRYDVALGYNWSALDTSINSSTRSSEYYKSDRGHILYRGEILLDPKEIPLKLNAYSRDMTRNTITTNSSTDMQTFSSIFGNNNEPNNINDGIHLESGATLVAGVKNGMTNGYNEVLRHFPMILVDYKNTINRDLRSINPVDNQLSRLAFVSLNKKDNWFHYRHTIFDDSIDNRNNYVENEIQLGTVDQNMTRRWVDFSNWLKVSTDLQLSKRKSNYQVNPIEEINLNLFLTGERKYWNARTFTTFNRYKDEYNKLSYQTTVPLYVSGVVSQDLSWNARTSFRDNHDIDSQGMSSKFINILAGYRVDAFKNAPFTLSQSFDAESSKTNLSDYVTLSGGIETTSTPRFSRNINLGAFYNIKNSMTSTDAVSSSDFLEQRLELHGSFTASNTLRFEMRQSTTLTKGNLTTFDGSTRNSQTLLSQYYNPRSQLSADIGSDSFNSVSTLSAFWSPKPRLNTYITLSEDVYKSSVLGISPVTEVLFGASFTNEAWSLSDTFKYAHGSRVSLDDNANSITNSTSLRYVHSRSLDASASASYTASSSNDNTYYDTNLEQRLNYNYFSRAGIARKLFEINETLLYADGTSNVNHAFNKSLMLGFKYYPIRQLTLATAAGYAYTTSIRDYTVVWNASATANFRLLQASLDYVSGIRKTDGARENRFTGNIRRSF